MLFVWIIQLLRGFRRLTLTNDPSDSDNESKQNSTKQTQEGKATKYSDEDVVEF